MEKDHPEWDKLSPREHIALSHTLVSKNEQRKALRFSTVGRRLWVWLAPVFVILVFVYCSLEVKENVTPQLREAAVELIKKGNYDKAVMTLVSYIDNDTGVKVLYNFASAKRAEVNGDIGLANYYMNEGKGNEGLVRSYDGPLSETVKSYAKTIAARNVEATRKQEEKRKRYEATRNQRGIHIGMTSEEVLESNWGKPKHINRHRTTYSYTEQWVYPNYNYLYFKEDEYGLLILTDIQN